jgi:hypothetical protein
LERYIQQRFRPACVRPVVAWTQMLGLLTRILPGADVVRLRRLQDPDPVSSVVLQLKPLALSPTPAVLNAGQRDISKGEYDEGQQLGSSRQRL